MHTQSHHSATRELGNWLDFDELLKHVDLLKFGGHKVYLIDELAHSISSHHRWDVWSRTCRIAWFPAPNRFAGG